MSFLLSLVGSPVVLFSSEFWGFCVFCCCATSVSVAVILPCLSVVVFPVVWWLCCVFRLCCGCVAVVVWFVVFPAGFVGGDGGGVGEVVVLVVMG